MTSSWNEEYIKKNKIIYLDNDRNTKLHYAAANGNLIEIKEEIANGKKLDPENYLGWTPLMMAVRNNQVEIVDLLLENFANITKENRFGINVFLQSIVIGNLDLVKKLLEHLLCGGVSRSIIQKTLSPLSLSILFNHKQIFRYLIERYFDINVATPQTGLTPLMCAAAVTNHKILRELLQMSQINVYAKNYLGRTAQDILTARSQDIVDIDQEVNQKDTAKLPQIQVHPPLLPQLQLSECNINNSLPAAMTPSQLTPFLLPSLTKTSSNVTTPAFCYSPNLSPIISVSLPYQVFFPANFSPNQIYQYDMSLFNYNSTNDNLNAAITTSNNEVFYS